MHAIITSKNKKAMNLKESRGRALYGKVWKEEGKEENDGVLFRFFVFKNICPLW